MNYRNVAIISTISNSFADAILDYAVNKYNYYKVLLYSSFVAFIIQLLFGLNTEIIATYSSLPWLLIHAVCIIFGYICFVKSLEYLPLGLVALIESGNLFIILTVDSYIGYIKITPYFLLMFALFIFSVILFSKDCSANKKLCFKEIKYQGYLWAIGCVILYASAPYLIKASNQSGANAFAVTLSYYVLVLPYFAYKCFTNNEKPSHKSQKWWNNLLFLSVGIGIFESAYYVLETQSFINDTPTIITIIEQMRIFLMFVLSVMFKMDKFTLRKTIALILGIISVVGVYHN